VSALVYLIKFGNPRGTSIRKEGRQREGKSFLDVTNLVYYIIVDNNRKNVPSW